MAVYFDDKGTFNYTYKIKGKQFTEDAGQIDKFPYYARKNGLYWIENDTMYVRQSGITTVVRQSEDYVGITRLIVVNNNTNILINRRNFFVQHNGFIRFQDVINDDFELYGDIIRNDNKLYSLYNFSSDLYGLVPIDCFRYIKYDNRHSMDVHYYINNDIEKSIGCKRQDLTKLLEIIYSDGGVYYILKDNYSAFLIDYPMNDKNISRVEVSGNEVMIYFTDRQELYHVGEIYPVPIGSTLP